MDVSVLVVRVFESSVNSEGIETTYRQQTTITVFESSVNSEGIETEALEFMLENGLRAV